MNLTSKIKYAVTAIAIILAIVHLIFPQISIDFITVFLLAVAIIPWLEPLFKSVELPGGLKLEFHDLKKIENEAKEAGLIKTDNTEDQLLLTNDTVYPFVEIAENNQELALVSLRIEIEKRLRKISEKYSIESRNPSITQLIRILDEKGILTHNETTALKNMIGTLNQASHGVKYDERNAEWVMKYGPIIIEGLENKIEQRGGRIAHGNPKVKEHWIDKSFNDCKPQTNLEIQECINKHLALWENELNNIYKALLKKLQGEQKNKLIVSQENWQKQIVSEQDFLYSFEDLQFKIGREGLLISAMHFMNKFKERTAPTLFTNLEFSSC